ncbi:hypothetical protein ABTX71_02095 [Streptomyces parvulus]|uniref:hypothetical protein n=1 Tax=Streptomyces parvulus TaxID=146923 RepID=UPI00331BBFA4
MAMTLKQIRARLRELTADPGRPGAKAEAQRLRGEAARLKQQAAPAKQPTAPADAEAAALATWPRELRARRGRSAMSRVIDGSNAPHDPNDYGAKSDLRRGRR